MIFYLIASAIILGEPVEIINSDCVKVERIQPAAPHRSKPVITKYRPRRIFKHEPKPVIEDCDEGPRLPPLTAIFPEPNTEFTPVPRLEPPDVLVPVVPGVETPECGCFGATGGQLPYWIGIPIPYGGVGVATFAPPVPESPVWALVGLGLLIAGRRTAVVKTLGQMTQRYLEVL